MVNVALTCGRFPPISLRHTPDDFHSDVMQRSLGCFPEHALGGPHWPLAH